MRIIFANCGKSVYMQDGRANLSVYRAINNLIRQILPKGAYMTQYTIEELNAKSIFEIRALAKELGVSSPAKKNKPELMELILKISSGSMQPPVPPRRGRPRKGSETSASTDGKDNSNENLSTLQPPEEVASDAQNKQAESTQSYDNRQRSFIPHFVRNSDSVNRRNDDGADRQKGSRFRETVLRESDDDEFQEREGYLEINPDNYGFLRVRYGEFNDKDAYVRSSTIKQYGLRRGDYVKGMCKKIQENRPIALFTVTEINGTPYEQVGKRPNFDDLVPIYPNERLRLEHSSREYATRCIDLVSPIGKGQRGIIVSPPKAGKTTLLKMIASSIAENYPEVELKVLLIDERPEEVTDMQRSIKGEVVYSTFDELPDNHTKTAEMLLDKAKRLVETGKDVVILLDSLTRLARAYNLTIPPTGRTLSGGIDPGALHSPKRFFGSARNIENGGSLTIIATALIDTGSRMDDVIFEEFKGTGNMEIHLDRKLSEKRIFPAIDLAKSGTRKEELLLTPSELEGTWSIRKLLANADNADATENLISMIVRTTTNKEFIEQLNAQLRMMQKEGYTFRGNGIK